MSKYVFDIETDGLLLECTKCHIIYAYDLDTDSLQYWLENDFGWKKVFDEAETLIGHNILGFDIFAMQKLFGWKPNKNTKLIDTLLLSQILDYKRFGNDGHSLEAWGNFLGYPKVVHEDWSVYSEAMRNRCEIDVRLNIKVYNILRKETQALIEKQPQMRTYLRAEHAVAKWCGMAELGGWPFDKPEAEKLLAIMQVEKDEAYIALSHKLGSKTVAVDKKLGKIEPKIPKWVKSGAYNVHTADWFGIHPSTGQDEDRLVEGSYSRVIFEPLDLNSVSDVKIFLFRNGWEPTQWNTKFNEETKRKEKTSPKITEDSLEFLGGDGKLYCDFLTTSSRYNNLRNWIAAVDVNGRLHGGCMTVGTPSMRARHNLIVNVPAANSVWGPEMRALFTTQPGWKVIGCDSSGNQARGLAHYLQSPEFTDKLLNDDIHTYNANTIDNILKEMGINWSTYLIKYHSIESDEKNTLEDNVAKVKRARAKRILYAFLFGAGGDKLWSYLFDVMNKTKGNKFKLGFQKAVPGLITLLDKLENIYGKTKQYETGHGGYIPGLAGNRIYCDSFHKLLVYLLQACEKATCAAAVMLTMERLEEANIPYQPLIFMHDEEDFLVPDEYVEQAMAIGKQAFIDGPKLFGVTIMDGDSKIGENWYDVH